MDYLNIIIIVDFYFFIVNNNQSFDLDGLIFPHHIFRLKPGFLKLLVKS